jgi:hypothetical protein
METYKCPSCSKTTGGNEKFCIACDRALILNALIVNIIGDTYRSKILSRICNPILSLNKKRTNKQLNLSKFLKRSHYE